MFSTWNQVLVASEILPLQMSYVTVVQWDKPTSKNQDCHGYLGLLWLCHRQRWPTCLIAHHQTVMEVGQNEEAAGFVDEKLVAHAAVALISFVPNGALAPGSQRSLSVSILLHPSPIRHPSVGRPASGVGWAGNLNRYFPAENVESVSITHTGIYINQP